MAAPAVTSLIVEGVRFAMQFCSCTLVLIFACTYVQISACAYVQNFACTYVHIFACTYASAGSSLHSVNAESRIRCMRFLAAVLAAVAGMDVERAWQCRRR